MSDVAHKRYNTVRTKKRKMSVVSALILVLLGALIHSSCALQCYECEYVSECHGDYHLCLRTKQLSNPACDDTLDATKVNKTTCDASANETVCATVKGTSIYTIKGQSTSIPFLLFMSWNFVGRQGLGLLKQDLCANYYRTLLARQPPAGAP